MSIPGLGGLGQAASTTSFSAPSAAATTANHELSPNSEWRFEVPVNRSIDVKLLSGTAEIFGTELALNHTYTFRGTKSAVYTWHGCQIAVSGSCDEYTAEETPMIQYVNTHFALEKLRAEDHEGGPCVLIAGPTNAGKTSLAKILTAYAIRVGRQPMVVNTDSSEGLCTIPGCLSATPFASILDVELGWASGPASGPGPVPEKLPLCYYYGLQSPEENTRLYKPMVTRLALAAMGRLAVDEGVRKAGVIIDTPGVISQGKGGYELIAHIVSEFSVNVILVLGSERLYSDLLRKFSNYKTSTTSTPITIVRLDKSGGCVDRDDTFSLQTREAAIKEYFFGDAKRVLSPHNQYINFDDLLIYRITDGTSTMSFLPGGAEDDVDGHDTSVAAPLYEPATPSAQMLHCVLAVVYASRGDGWETIRDASVMGFVYVAEVDEKRRRVRVLAPLSARVAERPLVWGRWPEAGVGVIG